MKRFSIGEAIGDGFGLVKRRPLAVFVWGLLMLAPAFGAMALILPAMGEVFASMPDPETAAAADEAFSGAMVGQMMQFQLASLLSNVVQLVLMAVIYTAIFRAVLRPKERSLFSLRLGMDELRVAVVGLAIGVGVYAVMVVAAILGVAVGFGVGASDPTAGIWAGALLATALVLGVLWLLARLSLIAPASVLYRDFAFAQGWKLASGKGWPLFGMSLLLFLMVLALYIVVLVIVAIAVGGAVAAMAPTWEAMQADANPFEGVGAWLTANWYWAVLAALVGSMFYGVLMTLMIAPFASACRQLAETSAPVGEVPSPEAVL
jgi:hypothetical protein